MCINPRLMPNGAMVPCHQCWQCRENRVNDWVGRCIAERESALACSVVTLTYGGGDTAESRFLRKSDITTYLKAIRNDGHKVRTFYTGEYGSKKGRAHWHVLLFWNTPMPHREFRVNMMDEYWPHGWSMWDNADIAGVRYVMKYINKMEGDAKALRTLGMSRKPILGWEYFYRLAGRYVEQGLSPRKPFYKFKDVLDKNGDVIQFYMPPLVQERFVAMFVAEWTRVHPNRWWPPSEMVDNYHEKAANYVAPLALERREFRAGPWMLPPNGKKPFFDEKRNSFYSDHDGKRLYWSFDEQGQRAWREEVVTETEAMKRMAVSDVRKNFSAQRA